MSEQFQLKKSKGKHLEANSKSIQVKNVTLNNWTLET